MKFKSLFLLAFFTVIATLIASSASAELKNGSAYFGSTHFSAHIIGDNFFYEDPSVSQFGYSWHSSQARSNWGAVGNADVDFIRVYNYSSANTRVFAGNYTWATYWGRMQPYTIDGEKVYDSDLDNPNKRWAKAHILINDHTMDNFRFDGTERLRIVTHEYGHMLGLRHQVAGTDSIMNKGVATKANAPTTLDYNNIRYKY